MWKNLAIGTVLAIHLVSCTQENARTVVRDEKIPTDEKVSADEKISGDEKAVRQQTEAWQKAYNAHDVDKLSALWAQDASYFNPVTGDKAEGREAIAKMYKDRFAKQKTRAIDIIVKNIDFPESDQAVEEGIIRLSMEGEPTQQYAFETLWAKQDNQWQLKEIREIALDEPPSNYDHLKELEWLVGSWIDSDENVDIKYDTQWDKNKNFLKQHFDMKVFDQDTFDGQQLIAWDPIEKTIRSWVFDSDGGFGEGKWTKQEDSWYAKMSYTLSDGRKAAATNIYTRKDDHTYTYASVGRDVEGQILPNLDPVNLTKVE